MRQPERVLAAAFATIVLSGCGETSGGAAVELAGASRAQHSGAARVYVTIDRLEAYVVDPIGRPTQKDGKTTPAAPVESGWRSVRLPVDRTFDLLQLGENHTKALGDLDLASGTITELRLALDEQGDNRVVLTTGESCVLDLSRFPSAGVAINDPTLPVDFDERHRVRLVVDFALDDTLRQGDPCHFALVPGVAIKALERQGEDVEAEPPQVQTDATHTR